MSPIPAGSLVLVTGANGFIASHTADQLLKKGYRVRGAIRSREKGGWIQDYADKTYGTGKLELVVIPDMGQPNAYDDAIKGCAGVVHVAADLSFSPDPNQVVTPAVRSVQGILTAATHVPTMRRFVYTSSTNAAYPKPDINKQYSITADMWNENAIKAAWAPPPYEPSRSINVYGASKAQAEKAMFDFVKEHGGHVAVNSVIPNTNFGPMLVPGIKHEPSTARWILNIYREGQIPQLPGVGLLPPQQAVDVRDTARLHVAALIDPDVENERLFAYAEPYNWKQVVDILKAAHPDHEFPGDIPDQGVDMGVVESKPRMEDILRRNFGVDGFNSLKGMLVDAVSHLKDLRRV